VTPPAAGQDAAARVYVRRIELHGVERTADHVLRGELLQLEGAFLNTAALDESLRRIRALPFVESVGASIQPVPGSPDLVDVVLTVTEAPARRYGGGGGWSESLRASARLYYTNENLFGTGQRLSLAADASELRSAFELSHTTPHIRSSEVARRIELSSRRVDRLTEDTAIVDARLTSLVLEYGYPLAGGGRRAASPGALVPVIADEETLLPTAEIRERLGALSDVLSELRPTSCCGTLRLGVALRRSEMTPTAGISTQLLDWIATQRDGPAGGELGRPSVDLGEADFLLRYRHDTRDRAVFPSAGAEHELRFTAALPGSEVEYGLADYRVGVYRPLGRRFTLRAMGRVAYGAGYGDSTSMPPYLHWFAGGPLTVRGFEENTLGPRDSFGNPYGGNLLVNARLELVTPWPDRWSDRVRVGLFVDTGNVFATEDVAFADADGRPLDYGFDFSALRRSAGLTAEILSPFGTLKLSYAAPLGAEDDHPNPFLRDEVDRFQISLGFDF